MSSLDTLGPNALQRAHLPKTFVKICLDFLCSVLTEEGKKAQAESTPETKSNGRKGAAPVKEMQESNESKG